VLDRVVPAAQRARADAFLTRWGALAVLASRSVPIAAETLALLAGASPLCGDAFCRPLRPDRCRRRSSTPRPAR
jgi:hypothetical protein